MAGVEQYRIRLLPHSQSCDNAKAIIQNKEQICKYIRSCFFAHDWRLHILNIHIKIVTLFGKEHITFTLLFFLKIQLQQSVLFHHGLQTFSVFLLHWTQRQTQLARAQAHHGQCLFDRNGIDLTEQLIDQIKQF